VVVLVEPLAVPETVVTIPSEIGPELICLTGSPAWLAHAVLAQPPDSNRMFPQAAQAKPKYLILSTKLAFIIFLICFWIFSSLFFLTIF
jgi:hypothetical protein